MNDPRTNHDAAPAARMIGRLLDERERLMVKQTVMDPDDDYIRERDTVF